jgi:putative MFS transporter
LNAATLAKKLDNSKLTAFHRRLIGVSGFGWMFDSMDVGIISFVVASLVKEWGLTSDQQGLIISMGMLGMFLGASVSGVLADRFGRKTIFQATLLFYSIATGLSALAWGLASLLVLRFLVGLGLGGELPVASTLVSEMAPAKERGRLLVILESFWAYGWIAAALIAYFVIPVWGWRIAFALGAVPALYVFVLRRGIPESPRFLLSKGRKAEAAAVAAKITGDDSLEAEALMGETEAKSSPTFSIKATIAGLWSRPYLRRTAMLWMLWFGIVYSYYGIFTWLPSILARDHSLVKSFEYVLIITLAQIPGYFSAAYLVEKLGRRWTLGLYLLMSAVSAYFFGQGGSDTTILIWGSLLSFFNLGAWGVVYTYTPEQYPTRMRGTGAGLAAGCGRIGGIVGPYIVGWLLGPANMGVTFVFGMFAVVLLLIALNVVVLGEETKGRTLEEIAQ